MPRRPPPPDWSEALGHPAADKRVEILRRVADGGSISQAARDAGVSYKAAWQALDTLSNLAGTALVERVVGGAGGGGARLTAAGEQVLHAAGQVAFARRQVLSQLASVPRAAGGLAALALRTSMRNQLPCRVERLRSRAGAVEVVLQLPGGDRLLSVVTRESVQLLDLVPGCEVLALCKATSVQIADGSAAMTANEPPGVAPNVLAGTVVRASRAAAGGEFALLLAGGQMLVGFAGGGHSLRKGNPAQATVPAAAVVIALQD